MLTPSIVCGCAVEWSRPPSSSTPITKLSAHIKESDAPTEAKWFNIRMYKRTNAAAQAKHNT